MSYDFTVADVIPALPKRIYTAWLDSAEHSAMTGGSALMASEVGGQFTAWDGYIAGVNLELEPFRRIVQSWRTTDYSANDGDSQIEVLFEGTPDSMGTWVIIHHTQVPEEQTSYQEVGWQENYFDPMKDYFSHHR
ncbi:MAG: SRPBCC domain-containing protein [Ktedonobacterales bacterium]|nr:SRPBCC domain-containing protein [Ktedonobacterales bacterium]